YLPVALGHDEQAGVAGQSRGQRLPLVFGPGVAENGAPEGDHRQVIIPGELADRHGTVHTILPRCGGAGSARNSLISRTTSAGRSSGTQWPVSRRIASWPLGMSGSIRRGTS